MATRAGAAVVPPATAVVNCGPLVPVLKTMANGPAAGPVTLTFRPGMPLRYAWSWVAVGWMPVV